MRRPVAEIIWLLAAWLLASQTGLGQAKTPIKLALQPRNFLGDFFAYRHISLIHFDVPENAVSIGFKFITKEEKTGGIGECSARNVTINVKSGSLPLVKPDGSKIGARLLEPRRTHYTISTLSDAEELYIRLVAPPPGDWYVIAYRSWSDPNNEKISQQGLSVSCDTILDAELWVEFPDVLHALGEDSSHNEFVSDLKQTGESSVMQFRIPQNTEKSTLRVHSSCGDGCKVLLSVVAKDHILRQTINATETNIEFRPFDDNSVHYVLLRLDSGPASVVTVGLTSTSALENVTEVYLTRDTAADFFRFDYDNLVGNSTKALPLNITAGITSVMRFKVGPVYDTGGTLSVGLKIVTDKNDNIDVDKNKDKVILVGCVTYGFHSPVTHAGNCIRSGSNGTQADILVLNGTGPEFVHVPYPEPGVWHLSVRAFCVDEVECGCFEECAKNGTSCESCDCARDCDARIETSIGSSPCIEGACNRHGRCVHYMSGGFVFSACHCTDGFRGFDCTDDDYVLSDAMVITRLSLLTLSNLAFIGAVFVAVRRGYYTEAIVYAAVMFFSTFYHACEGGNESHSFCLIKLSVLQFCDFYNALLSIWVTLVAMASLGARATSFCQMLGVVVLAVGAELDRTALWVFLLPAVFGLTLIIASWTYKCRQKGTFLYPAKMYRLVYLPIGLVIVIVGLVAYAFLQTRSNYYIVHSIWHICVAFGVIFLLPKPEYME